MPAPARDHDAGDRQRHAPPPGSSARRRARGRRGPSARESKVSIWKVENVVSAPAKPVPSSGRQCVVGRDALGQPRQQPAQEERAEQVGDEGRPGPCACRVRQRLGQAAPGQRTRGAAGEDRPKRTRSTLKKGPPVIACSVTAEPRLTV